MNKKNRALARVDEVKKGLFEMRKRLAASLSDGDANRFSAIILNCLDENPKLANCKPASVLAVAMLMAQTRLEPGPLGLAYMIPRKGEATFQIGYRGLIQLALRSGDVGSVYAHAVRENDRFKIEFGTTEVIRHTPAMSNRGDVVGYYAVAKLVNGATSFDFMNIEEVHAVRDQYGYVGSESAWLSAPTEMGKKTVVKRLAKYLPMHTDFARALSFDGVSIDVTPDGEISTEEVQFFDVVDAMPEKFEEQPKIEPTKKVVKFTIENERKFLRATVAVFSKERAEQIYKATKKKCGIKSLANGADVTQEQLEKLHKITAWYSKGDEQVLKDNTDRVLKDFGEVEEVKEPTKSEPDEMAKAFQKATARLTDSQFEFLLDILQDRFGKADFASLDAKEAEEVIGAFTKCEDVGAALEILKVAQ